MNHSHTSNNRDGVVGKKTASSTARKSLDKSSFNRRSEHQSSASVDDKWTHDLFEQHELSDGDGKARRSKPARVKKTPSKKVFVFYLYVYLHLSLLLFSRFIQQRSCV